MKINHKNKGFTLMELLIVIIIIGLLIAIAVPEIHAIVREARVRTMKTSLRGLSTALKSAQALDPIGMHPPVDLCRGLTRLPGSPTGEGAAAPTPRFIKDRDEIWGVIDRVAGTPSCSTVPAIPRLCFQVDHVVLGDETVTTLAGDTGGNVILGGICTATGVAI